MAGQTRIYVRLTTPFPAFLLLPRFASCGAQRLTPATAGWRGILYANLALVDPKASYAFFRDGQNGFWDERWINGGASRTWYLVFAAGLGEGGRR